MTRFDKFDKKWAVFLLTSTVTLAVCVAFSVMDRIDNFLYDAVMRHSQHEPDRRILLVTIDNRSLTEVGAWPWSRSIVAELLEQIAQARPKAILLDLVLTEHSSQASDTRLAEAIARAPVYLPALFDAPGRNGSAYDIAMPLAELSTAAAGVGHVNLMFDRDGTVRRTYRFYGDGIHEWQQLTDLMANGNLTSAINKANKFVYADTTGVNILQPKQPMLINYAGLQGRFPTISASSVIRGEVPATLLKDRMILIGATASALGDAYSTPSSAGDALTPGIEIQANILNSILANDFIISVGAPVLYAFTLAPLLLLHVALRFMKPIATLVTISTLIALILTISLFLLQKMHLWIPPGCALLGIVSIYPYWLWRRLAAASGYMASELKHIEDGEDLLRRPQVELKQVDFVERQIGLLRLKMNGERDIRHFLIDRISQMPDAVMIVEKTGEIILSNAGAVKLLQVFSPGHQLKTANDLLGNLLRTSSGSARPIYFEDIAVSNSVAWSCEVQTSSMQHFNVRVEPQWSDGGALIGFVIRIADTNNATAIQGQREELLQLLTHDMRAPQASIIMLLDQANKSDWNSDLSKRIVTYAKRTLKLADDFVQLSRVQSKQYKFQILNFCDIGKEAVDALAPQASARQIVLNVLIEDDEILVSGDPSLLQRALINLLDNAIKFSPVGSGIEIVISRTGRDQKKSVACSVIDNGVGIPLAQMGALYDRFERVSASSASDPGGAGLGLAFVKAVMTRHGGTIHCESREGLGTTFRIELSTC